METRVQGPNRILRPVGNLAQILCESTLRPGRCYSVSGISGSCLIMPGQLTVNRTVDGLEEHSGDGKDAMGMNGATSQC